MRANLSRWIDAFAGLPVAVLGEAMLDTYLEGNASRFCSENGVESRSGAVV
jgi:hypothetical protein